MRTGSFPKNVPPERPKKQKRTGLTKIEGYGADGRRPRERSQRTPRLEHTKCRGTARVSGEGPEGTFQRRKTTGLRDTRERTPVGGLLVKMNGRSWERAGERAGFKKRREGPQPATRGCKGDTHTKPGVGKRKTSKEGKEQLSKKSRPRGRLPIIQKRERKPKTHSQREDWFQTTE